MGAGREVSISLDNVRDKNMMQLKKINIALFPVRYNDKYYSDALASADFTKLAKKLADAHVLHFNSLCYIEMSVRHEFLREERIPGSVLKRNLSVRCGREQVGESNDIVKMARRRSEQGVGLNAYYSDICVGSIACRLEKKEGGAVCVYIMTLGVLAPYRGLGIGTTLLNHVIDLCTKQNIREIYVHMQTSNEDAINFYKKFSFEVTDTIKNYYTNITPPECYVLTKFISQTKK